MTMEFSIGSLFSVFLPVIIAFCLFKKYFSSSTTSTTTIMNPTGPPDAATVAWIDLPLDYQKLSAREKSDLLWHKITSSKYTTLPSWGGVGIKLKTLKTCLFELAPVFTGNPYNSDIALTGHVRGIHNYGVIGRVQLEMLSAEQLQQNKKEKFTGMLAPGASSFGLARLGYSSDPSLFGIVPGMGLKLFVNGRPSVNTVAVNNVEGQGMNTDFFHSFVRTAGPDPIWLTFKVLKVLTDRVEPNSHTLLVRDFARFDDAQTTDHQHQPAKPVEQPAYPWMLKFVPDARLVGLIPTNSTKDFRTDLTQLVTPGPLYQVYAAESFDDENAYKIGTLKLTSELVASHFGDERILFRHPRKDPLQTVTN